MANRRIRDLIVLLPGITGSVLQKEGRDLWAISGQAVHSALTGLASDLDKLWLGYDDPKTPTLNDGIRATRLMRDVHIIPGLIKVDGYSGISRMIKENFKIEPENINDNRQPANFFEFPYDWRRDNRHAAYRLKELIDKRLPQWRKERWEKDAKVILIAHSMGGLIARYYLEVLEGWRDCKALITFGTPHRGAVSALEFLVNGYKKLCVDLTVVMRSFTSTYQLLPIYEAVRVGGTFYRVAEVDGIPGIERSRALQALAFHREIEGAVKMHQHDVEYLTNGYKLLPIVGTRQPTLQSAVLADGRLTASRRLPDGKVVTATNKHLALHE